jgi:hypothetical protein
VTTIARRPPSDFVVWGIPTATLLHNLEEGLTVARYLPRVRQLAPEPLRRGIPGLESVYVALIVVTAIPVAFALLARRSRSACWATSGLLLVAAILLVNVAWHLVAAFTLGGYAPGLATALAVNLPVTVAALHWARSNAWLSRRGLAAMLLIAVLLHGPIPMTAVVLTRWLS